MSAIVRLKIVLKDVEPKVIRRIEVPLAIKLDRLHDVLQAVMGWGDYHLYEFRFRGDVGFGIPDPDWPDDMLDGANDCSRCVGLAAHEPIQLVCQIAAQRKELPCVL